MDEFTGFINDFFGLTPDDQGKILTSLIIILVVMVLRWGINRIVHRQVQDPTQRYYWTRVVTYLLVFAGILGVMRVWLPGISSIINYLGIVSAGIAIALHDVIASLAGWVFILWRRPFQVGDRVQIGEDAGDVIDIRLFQFSLLEIRNWVDADQSTGRILNIPNSRVFRETLANYTKGFQYIWHEIPVLITFESNWRQAEEIMKEIAASQVEQLSTAAAEEVRRAAKRYLIHYGKLTPIVYLSVKDSGVLLTLRYMVESRRRRGTEEGIWRAILEEFAKHDDIDFAYPTVRYYDGLAEGKRVGKAEAHAE